MENDIIQMNKQYKILVVEDSLTQAMKLQYILEKVGYEVFMSSNGHEAMAFLKIHIPDLLISDIIMPEMSGYDLCRLLRETPELTHIPVILLTSLSETDYVIHGLESGANGFVTKPYNESYLLARIHDVIENHHYQQTNDKAIKFCFSGKEYNVVADRLQILEMLISTYSNVLQKNDELNVTKNDLELLNTSLEQAVQNRTIQLQHEVDDRKKAEYYLKVQYELNKILAESISLEESADKIFSIIRQSSECDMCCIWEDTHHGTILHNISVWVAPGLNASDFVKYTTQTAYDNNNDFLGKIWTGGKIEFFQIKDALENSVRANKAYVAGMRNVLIIPIVIFGKPAGVMEFYWQELITISNPLLSLLQAFSAQIGEFIRRVHLQQQFYQSQKMESIGQLTGGIAHDFNNLLMIIQGNLELLLVQKVSEKAEAYIHTALAAIERGAEFNQRLLAFSRKQVLQPQKIQITQTIRNIIKLLKPLLGERIIVNALLPDDIDEIFVDPAQFENALMNLAVNARDAMHHVGTLEIEVQNILIDNKMIANKYEIPPGPYIKISITDTGDGIPAELIERVFEPFFTTKETGKGTGLGLSMVYGFVKQSKGHVTIYSEINQGTTINLYLPKADETIDSDKKEENKPVVLLGQEKILVVEDEEDLRQVVVEYLSGLGYVVVQARNTDEALGVIEKNDDIELLFTDIITQSALTGSELAAKAQQIYPHIKVLFTSGYPQNALKNKMDNTQSFDNFLAKPYKIQNLGIKVRQILDQENSPDR